MTSGIPGWHHLRRGVRKVLDVTVARPTAYTRLCREYEDLVVKSRTVLQEFHACVAMYVLPEVGTCPRRIELLTQLIGTPVGAALYLIASLQKVLPLETQYERGCHQRQCSYSTHVFSCERQ